MNNKFLYKKAYPLGVLVDMEEESLEDWFLDNSQSILEKKFRECDLVELILELVNVFEQGEPNYVQLALLFGFESSEESPNANQMIFKEIHRGDISKIVMDIEMNNTNKELMLRNLCLHTHEKVDIDKLAYELSIKFSNIQYEKTNGITLSENNCKIMIL